MEIGTIGAGDFAQAFAKQALKAGHKIKLSNSRGPDSLRKIVDQLGAGATAASREEAAACEMVLLAVPWDNVPETLASLPKWNNQILIDGVNTLHGKAGEFTLADVGNLSASQFIAALAPGARVVKALNTITVSKLARLSQKTARISHAAGLGSGFEALSLLDERMDGIQRPRSKVATQACCSGVRSGASNTVAGRPRCLPRTRTNVAWIADNAFIMLCADF